MLVDFNFERYDPKTRGPYSLIGWTAEENAFFHPWSLEQSGEHYGYHKLTELISPKDYLNLPNVVVDEFLEAVSKGLNKRDKFEEDRRKEAERKQGKQQPRGQQEELIRAGIDPSLVKP